MGRNWATCDKPLVQSFWALQQSLWVAAARSISVRSRLILTTVSFLLVHHHLIPSVTLSSIPAWPLWVSSASHFCNHSHWKALHSTGWPNTQRADVKDTGTLDRRPRRLCLFFLIFVLSFTFSKQSIFASRSLFVRHDLIKTYIGRIKVA